ncbi:MAG: CoA transferase [Dehalococcoidia bacterium]|nr:CoA transferase [Dehalococcoidia bacterium]
MTQALDGIRVVDFGQYIAGPLLGMILADQGADVIHIDPPTGPSWDTPANQIWHRGKKTISLDLKDPADNKVAKSIIDSADILIENFRPGVMSRLGMDYSQVVVSNPGLIYCSMPGFAHDDPRSTMRGWEGIIGAATWTYRPSGSGKNSNRPVYTPIPIASSYAAFISSVSISMALFHRESYGYGQNIEVPLFDAMFPAMGSRVITMHDKQTTNTRGSNATWTRTFECSDGQWVQYHAGNLKFSDFLKFTKAVNWPSSDSPAVESDRMEKLFRTRSASEWEDLISDMGSECSICRTSAEWIIHPHARESGMVAEVKGTVLGDMLQPGINARLSKTPGNIRGPVTNIDIGSIDMTPKFSLGDVESKQVYAQQKHPILEGIKVLDLCIVLAGPTCGRTLAEFGANVIKIDSPDRLRVSFHNEINRAKRSIVLDLKTQSGLDIFWKLVEDADIIVQNFRKGVAEKLGIGYDQVKTRKPDIIYASLNTYGQEGELSSRPGHEQIAQAATGMQKRFGGTGQPLTQPFAINDYGTGYMGAYGVVLALLNRNRTGEGQHVDTALTYTSCTLQSPFFMDFPGKNWDETSGQDALGSSVFNRAYKCNDGWVFVSLPSSHAEKLANIGIQGDIAGFGMRDLEIDLEEKIAEQSTEYWIELFGKIDIAAHRVVEKASELLENEWVMSHGLSVTREHQELGRITTTGPAPRLSVTPVFIGRQAPKPGSDAKEILAEIGLVEEFDGLVSENIVRIDGIVPG